jgi:hypothetical protein
MVWFKLPFVVSVEPPWWQLTTLQIDVNFSNPKQYRYFLPL